MMIEKKLILQVQRVDTERHCYIVRYQGEYVPVPQYPFQYNLRMPATLICVNTTPGLPVPSLVQCRKNVIESLYEEDVPYQFSVTKMTRSERGGFDVELKDQYGFTHNYRNAGRQAILSLGKKIELYIHTINEDGNLTFNNNDNFEGKPTDTHSTITDAERANFNRLYDNRIAVQQSFFDNPDFSGVWKLVIDKYPDRAHFVYELLQNADDAKATKVGFYLFKDGLVFKHNGTVPFSVTNPSDTSIMGHINSITGIRSTKDDVICNTIGKFGVGFKAVYTYTSRPEIFDDKFRFAIDKYIVPVWLEYDHPMRQTGETLFYFPFKNPITAYSDINKKLKTIENPSLFLNSLEEVRWVNESGEKGYFSKKTIKEYSIKDTICRHLSMINNNDSRELWLFTWCTQIRNHGNHNISVGYYLDKNGGIDTDVRNPIYCFFPTSEKIDMCCIMHAPFLLTDNRQNVTDSEENRLMIEKLSWLAAAALPILRDEDISHGTNLLQDKLFDIVPLRKNLYHHDWELFDIDLFFKSYRDIIYNEPMLLSRNGKYLRTNKTILPGRKEIAELLSVSQLNFLLGSDNEEYDFLSPSSMSSTIENYLSDFLAVRTFGYLELAKQITPEFMQNQKLDWISKFYYSIYDNAKSYLKNQKQSDWYRHSERPKPVFRKAPIFKNQHGEWIPPFKGERLDVANIFKPSSIIDSTTNVVAKELYELKNCQTLLDELEIGELNVYEKVKEALIKYEGNSSVDTSEYTDDFELFLTYFQKANPDERLEFIEKIKNYPFLFFKERNGVSSQAKASDLCLKSDMLSRYLNGYTSAKIRFLDDGLYSSVEEKYGIDKINSFLRELGAKQFPSVSKVELEFDQLSDVQKRFTYTCPNKYTQYYADYQIPGLKHAISTGSVDSEISKMIWDELARQSLDSLKFTVSTFYYKSIEKTTDSSLFDLLLSNQWLFIDETHARKPEDVTIEQLLEFGYKPNNELYTYLGIRHDASDILSLGGTQEQQEIQDKGQIVKGYDRETIQEMVRLYEQKKNREKPNYDKENYPSRINHTFQLLSYHKTEMTDNTIDTLFSCNSSKTTQPKSGQSKNQNPRLSDNDIADLANKLDKEKEKKLTLEKLRMSVSNMDKYSMEWFLSLIELELHTTGEDNFQSPDSINISFSEVSQSADSKRIYVLKNPSRLIPMQLEEIGGMTVSFTFCNQESFTKVFDVACVRNFTLLLKANQEDVESLSKIDWSQCTQAEVSINNISDLGKRLFTAFKQLGFSPDYNLKEHLNDNISFVFGPPGTGKTTYLSRKITDILNHGDSRILVLAPTNKACDVLTVKILSQSEVNYSRTGRFVATALSEIEDNGILINRQSPFLEKHSCCLISTIARLPYDGFESSDGKGALRNINWDYIIIDEASMIPIAYITYSIYKFRTAKIIIAGDPFQIAPIVQENVWKDENIYTMTNLLSFESPRTEPIPFDITFLDTQFRSLPAIGDLFSHYAYSGLLKSYRAADSQRKIKVEGMTFGNVNFMPFRVDKYDSLYGPKKLNGSNVHLYSAILVVEFAKYIASHYVQEDAEDSISIGIICPYAPQAHIIHNLLNQQQNSACIHITVGTIHGFQGDECDIIITVFNPPTGLKGAAHSVLINNRNIVNVAISRAKDYLFIFMPSSDTDGFEYLFELNTLGRIAKQHCDNVKVINSDVLEQILFKQRLYIENHSFVTSHQLTNVYTEAQAKFEIRINNNAVDIQIDNTI